MLHSGPVVAELSSCFLWAEYKIVKSPNTIPADGRSMINEGKASTKTGGAGVGRINRLARIKQSLVSRENDLLEHSSIARASTGPASGLPL